MKKVIFLLFMILMVAQIDAQVMESEQTMSKGVNNSLSVELLGTEQKEMQKAWVNHIKKYKGKTKLNKKTTEIFTDNAMIEGVSENTVDLYATVTKIEGGTKLTVWYFLGGAYLSSAMHPTQYPVAETMLKDFAQSYSKGLAEAALEAEEKKLKKIKGDLTSLEKDKKDYEEKIKDLQAQIEKLKGKITENETAQSTTKADLEKQSQVVEAAKKKVDGMK